MNDLTQWLSDKIVLSLRTLLEGKHLYQSVTVDRDAICSEAVSKFKGVDLALLQGAVNDALDSDWFPHDERSVQYRGFAGSNGPPAPIRISFILGNVKTVCSECGAITPFNLTAELDVYSSERGRWAPMQEFQGRQEFVFSFECQSCRTDSDVFLVRRRGLRLTLCGRSPMELALVPKFIPKSIQRYYSNAVVAFQSGQILAALFLLRVLIEQFTRANVGATENSRADEVLDQYTSVLPDDFKARFPSLREVYGSLSAAIHTADESGEIFEISRTKIEKHFDARRMFEL